MELFSFDLLPSSLSSVTAAQGGHGARTLRIALKQQYAKLLPEAIGLTDAFGFSDWELERYVNRMVVNKFFFV